MGPSPILRIHPPTRPTILDATPAQRRVPACAGNQISNSSSGGKHTQTATMVHVSAIFIYPVKSCRGISLQSAQLTPLGACLPPIRPATELLGRCRAQHDPRPAVVHVGCDWASGAALPAYVFMGTQVGRGGHTHVRPHVDLHDDDSHPLRPCMHRSTYLPAGLFYDRQWMVVNADTGKCITQRQKPKMCLVSARSTDGVPSHGRTLGALLGGPVALACCQALVVAGLA